MTQAEKEQMLIDLVRQHGTPWLSVVDLRKLSGWKSKITSENKELVSVVLKLASHGWLDCTGGWYGEGSFRVRIPNDNA
jgi:hypothetical protein